jgi:hypothetical protein
MYYFIFILIKDVENKLMPKIWKLLLKVEIVEKLKIKVLIYYKTYIEVNQFEFMHGKRL